MELITEGIVEVFCDKCIMGYEAWFTPKVDEQKEQQVSFLKHFKEVHKKHCNGKVEVIESYQNRWYDNEGSEKAHEEFLKLLEKFNKENKEDE